VYFFLTFWKRKILFWCKKVIQNVEKLLEKNFLGKNIPWNKFVVPKQNSLNNFFCLLFFPTIQDSNFLLFSSFFATLRSLEWSLFSAVRLRQKKTQRDLQRDSKVMKKHKKSLLSLKEKISTCFHRIQRKTRASFFHHLARRKTKLIIFLSTLSLFDSVSLFGNLKLKPFFESLLLKVRELSPLSN
jgi:hypothetical protein